MGTQEGHMAPRVMGKLTPARVRNTKEEGLISDGGNLYLEVTAGRGGHVRKSWVFRYTIDGRRHDLGLGGLGTRGLLEAREEARQLRLLLLAGDDPLTTKRQQYEQKRRDRQELAARKTFRECTELFLGLHTEGLGRNEKHRRQWRTTVETYAHPIIGDLYIGQIDTSHIVSVLSQNNLWNTRRVTARRVLGRIARIIGFAIAAGYRLSGENPARWTGHLRDLLPSDRNQVDHYTALPFAEVGGFVAELRQLDKLPARALEFAILTAARAGEVLGATWDEFDLKDRIWTIPASRMKAGRVHRVPLCGRAVKILDNMERLGDRPFAIGNDAMRELSRRMCRCTAHGFRSSFMDWAHEQTAFPKAVIDLALAHAIGDKVEAAYRRGDLFRKRRQLMDAWAEYCSKPAPDSSAVVSMRKGGADA
jgi:integrase